MKAIGAVLTVLLTVFSAGALVLPLQAGRAQSATSGTRVAQAGPTDTSEPPPVRRRLRIHPNYVHPNYEAVPEVYPRYYPGPNAVRECNATYVQEYRPSGTVIVPRMTCYWSR